MRRIGAKYLKGDGASRSVKPLAAAVRMAPALKMHAFWVFALKQVAFKIRIRRPGPIALKMGLAARRQFGLFGVNAAIGTIKN